MSPIVALLLWTAFATMNWGLFGWLIAAGIQRHKSLDRLPIWPIAGLAAIGCIFGLILGVPPGLLDS